MEDGETKATYDGVGAEYWRVLRMGTLASLGYSYWRSG